MLKLFLGLIGLMFLIAAVFDIDWILNLTADAQRGYYAGKKFTRILVGFVGFLFVVLFILSK